MAGLDTVVTRYTTFPPGGAVELWTINGGGHYSDALRAIPLFLLAAWYLEQLPLDPENLIPLGRASAFNVSWGLLLMLAPWPLHGSAVSLGEDAPPLVAAWLLTVLVVVPVTLLQAFLVRFEWLQGAVLFA